MNEKNIIEAIINLPSKFYSLEDRSMYSLLKETRYFELFDRITESDIYSALNQQPTLVAQWMIWSENKRTTSGWYFIKEGDKDQYTVIFLPAKPGYERLEFQDVKKACAAFIKRELEEFRLMRIV